MQQTISMRFDDDTLARLDELAGNMERPRSALIKEAVAHYLDYVTQFSAEVQKGLDDVEAGRVISHEEMKSRIRTLGIHVD